MTVLLLLLWSCLMFSSFKPSGVWENTLRCCIVLWHSLLFNIKFSLRDDVFLLREINVTILDGLEISTTSMTTLFDLTWRLMEFRVTKVHNTSNSNLKRLFEKILQHRWRGWFCMCNSSSSPRFLLELVKTFDYHGDFLVLPYIFSVHLKLNLSGPNSNLLLSNRFN